MKIDSVHLENFGLYGSKRFRFDGHPLVLIYGANESGKTTALNGLRQALFGFPRNSAYITGKTMSAEGHVTLADGRRVRFNRQKKNSDGFSATIDGKIPLTESEWNQLASGLDLKAYQSLFGFSLEELRSGEKALAHAPIEQALSSSGFGGLARLQAVQNRIDEYLNTSLKRVGTSGIINAKLAEIEEAEKHLESVLTLPADVAELRSKLPTRSSACSSSNPSFNIFARSCRPRSASKQPCRPVRNINRFCNRSASSASRNNSIMSFGSNGRVIESTGRPAQ